MTQKKNNEAYLKSLELEKSEDEFWNRLDDRLGPYIRSLNLALALTLLFFMIGSTWESIGLDQPRGKLFQTMSGILLALSAGEFYAYLSIAKGGLARTLKEAGLDRRHRRAFCWAIIAGLLSLIVTFSAPELLGGKSALITLFAVSYQLILVAINAIHLSLLSGLRTLHDARPDCDSNYASHSTA